MISKKQKKILAFPYSRYDAMICNGAVRSGKTSIMMWAFVDWAMREFSGQRFGICGRPAGSGWPIWRPGWEYLPETCT